MALITGSSETRIRWVWSGVAGAPYYSSLVVDDQDGDVDYYTAKIEDFLDDVAAYQVNDITWALPPTHEVFDIDTGQVVGIATSNSRSGAGTDAGSMLPRATQVKISLHTGEFVNGRELRGALFLPALQSGVNSAAGKLDESTAVAIETLAEFLFLDSSGFNHAGAVYSPTHRVSALVESVAVNREFSVLRSRRD